MSNLLDIDQTKKQHPPAPIVPGEAAWNDQVYLNGANAKDFSGLRAFRFTALEDKKSALIGASRTMDGYASFKVHPLLFGKYEVSGEYNPESSVAAENRSFGTINITQSK